MKFIEMSYLQLKEKLKTFLKPEEAKKMTEQEGA